MNCKYYLLLVLLSFVTINANSQNDKPFVHDPVMAKGEDGKYYIFATGMGIDVLSSENMKEWKREKPVFDPKTEIPSWAKDSVRGYRGHTWAPDITYQNGEWHLYYSCSTFGKNTSAIGVATNKTLDPTSPHFKWIDKGMVIKSHKGQDMWNAIDPNFIKSDRKRYMTYGSFWDGIQLIKLEKDCKTLATKPVTIARRVNRVMGSNELFDKSTFTIEGGDTIEAGENAIEAPFITYRDGYYYLFVSFDYCCRGQNSTYKTVYGRSKNVEGPYVDRNGKRMDKGGGTYLCGPNDEFFGIGHCAVYNVDDKWIFLSHAYDKSLGGRARLFIEPLEFDENGWIKPLTK